MVVYLVLFPLNPLRLVERRARPVIDLFNTELGTVADSLSTRDLVGVEATLSRLRDADAGLLKARQAMRTAMEVATLAPARRHDRPILVAYTSGFEFLERALRGSRGVVRRAAELIRDEERMPDQIASALRKLGHAIRMMHRDLLAGRSTQAAVAASLDAAVDAARSYAHDPGPHAIVAIALIRTAASDLLRASGADRRRSRELLREAYRDAGLPP